MLALLFVAASSAFIDIETCQTVGTSVKAMPSASADMLGNWQALMPPSSMYMSNIMVQMNNSVLRLVSMPTVSTPLAALEYMIPTQNNTARVWLYEVSYSCIQSAGNMSSQFGIGPWHAIGFDWAVHGATPNLTALRFASGANGGRVQNSLVRIDDNVTSIEDIVWDTRNVSDVRGELRSFKYRFVYDGAAIFPASLQSDFGEAVVTQQAATVAPNRWQLPTRLVVIASNNVLFFTRFELSRTEYSCATTQTPDKSTAVVSTVATHTESTMSISLSQVVTPFVKPSVATTMQSTAPASAPATTEPHTIVSPPTTSRVDISWAPIIVAVVGLLLLSLVVISTIYQLKHRVSTTERHVTEPALVENPKSVYGPINVFVVQPSEVIYDKVLAPSSIYDQIPQKQSPYDSPTSELK